MALTVEHGLNVKLRDFLFDTPLQNMNRAGLDLSIIYTLSFSVSCLSALVAVTCPDTNGGWLSENIYQCYSRVLQNSVPLSFFNRRALKLQRSQSVLLFGPT